MKYRIPTGFVPQHKRKETNQKILYLIENDLCEKYGITRQDVFALYTGDGGLHGLNRSNYDSYHAYSQAKKEIEQGQFFTPPAACAFLVKMLSPSPDDLVADLTAGRGDMFNALPNLHNAYACELDLKAFKVLRYLFPEVKATCEDIRFYNPPIRFDIILGNPPYNLRWRVGDKEYISQLYYCIKAAELLKPAGLLALIVPSSFLADPFLDGGMIREIDERFRFIWQADLPEDLFAPLGVERYATKIMLLQKRSEHLPDRPYRADQKDRIENLDDDTAWAIHQEVVAPILAEKARLAPKLRLEFLKGANQGDRKFQERVAKLMFDIKRHPAIRHRLAECQEMLFRFETQKRPEGMSAEEWERVQITQDQVIAYLKSVLRSQHHKPVRPGVRLVKSQYGLRWRSDDPEEDRRYVHTYVPFYKLVQYDENPFEGHGFERLVARKRREYLRQEMQFEDMSPDPEIARFLDELVIYDSLQEREIRLNPQQKHDVNLLLQKRYSFLQWEQGSGKSVAGTAMLLYRLKKGQVRNVFVVGPAIAINNTWNVILPSYGIACRRIRRIADLNAVQPGEVVLITLNVLVELQRHVKRLVKKVGRKRTMLILDECDAISAPMSRRTKAVLSVFRKLGYKVLMTGTMTRNNIVEAAPQFELLYNNSYNMISEAPVLYHRSKDNPDELIEESNPYYGHPIPAYTAGYRLFSESHLPEKVTVFGIGKFTQDVYNVDALKRLLGKTVITRSFEEVTGRKPYQPIQHTVVFHAAERELYARIVDNFYSMKDHYFTSTGDLRKDRFLEILQQLLLMLRATTVPHLFKEYRSNRLPSKVEKMLQLIERWPDQHVAVGVRHIDVAHAYADAIRQRFPRRPVFVITGNEVSLDKRRVMVAQFRQTGNGILVATQQSLSSSVNIGFVNRVIIPELHWNDPAMSQFYFRFIRYDSLDPDKQVHFITYVGTIESNLLAMVLAKQRLNLLMKNQETDEDELMEKFGVSFDLLNQLMRKERDEEGKVKLHWGQQTIA